MIRARMIEHKTSTEDIGPGSAYWQRLILDNQISNYNTGLRALGYEPIDILYDVAKRPALRPSLATPEESREYTKPKDRACKECKKKTPAPLPHVETVGEGDDAREVTCVEGRIVTDPGGKLYANLREFDETPEEFRLRLQADIAAGPEKYYQRGVVVRLEEEVRASAKDTWNLARWIREVQLESRDDPEAWPRNSDACFTYGSACDFWPVCSGQGSLDDATRYRRTTGSHEELAPPPAGSVEGAEVAAVAAVSKRRLPLVTTSSMKTFRSCPRKYYLRYELGYRLLITSDAMRFGTLFHKGLEVWWTTTDLGLAIETMRAAESDPFELIKAEELLRGYHARWINEPLTVLAVEAQFEAPLINPTTGAESRTFRLAGKIDAIVAAPHAA